MREDFPRKKRKRPSAGGTEQGDGEHTLPALGNGGHASNSSKKQKQLQHTAAQPRAEAKRETKAVAQIDKPTAAAPGPKPGTGGAPAKPKQLSLEGQRKHNGVAGQHAQHRQHQKQQSSNPPFARPAPAKHTFTVDDPRDHAETPFEAYRDLEPLLSRLAQQLGKPKASLRIYDPYYCAGTCVAHLSRLGFTDVYNRNEDFYLVQAQGRCPEFDVLITNPPFSGDHMHRALKFAASCGKPWALLMPDFVARKAYYSEVLQLTSTSAGNGSKAKLKETSASQPQAQPASLEGARTSPVCGPLYYLGPTSSPYRFSLPNLQGSPTQPSAPGTGSAHTFTPAAFQCVWFLSFGNSHSGPVIKWWSRKQKSLGPGTGGPSASGGTCILAADAVDLPQLAMDRILKRRQEEAVRKTWRKKLSRQRKQAAKAAASM